MNSERRIQSVISGICDELRIEYKFNSLRTDKVRFNKCYSAIWLIQDITEAFEVYKAYAKKEQELELGTKYLMIYGVLEALYLQLNALNDLRDSLGYEKVNYKEKHLEIYKIKRNKKRCCRTPYM